MNNETTIRFADRMNQLPPYLFGMINKIKMEKRWEGIDVIDLGMGNPMDPTPGKVTDKLCEVASIPRPIAIRLAGGMKNLKREIALYYRRNYGVELDWRGRRHLHHRLQGGHLPPLPGPARPGRHGARALALAFPIHVYAAVIAGASVLRFPLDRRRPCLAQVSQMCTVALSRAQAA